MNEILSASVLATVGVAIVAALTWSPASTLLKFCWNCFFKPLAKGSQQAKLESFYKSQAGIYDSTRRTLLKGREDMLQLAKSHLRQKRDLIWVDMGGGTGSNIEYMSKLMPLSCFKAIYLVDLSPSLCKIAEDRMRRLGVKNVYIHCKDVCEFELPAQKSAHLVTFSYSLSMIPSYHSAVDRVSNLLNDDGMLGVVDFYVPSSSDTPAIRAATVGGELARHVNWLSRNFWRLWFEFDHVHLDPARREYLEYRLGTVKSLNCRNKTLGGIPYYIWIGCSKHSAKDVQYRHELATESPVLKPRIPDAVLKGSDDDEESNQIVCVRSKGHEAAERSLAQNLPYPSFYYQREIWRIYYDARAPHHHQFNDQYIYAFTWEDPRSDQEILSLGKNDVVLAITSAGDNLLAYAALDEPPRRIHGVDMNPHQNHLAELKLAALRALNYEDMWKLFGEGKHDNFQRLLVEKLAVHLSSPALQFWYKEGRRTFSGAGLYNTGSTRWALRLARWVFKVAGLQQDVIKFCQSKSMEEQIEIWDSKLRPALLSPVLARLLLGNAVFLWKALGVPINQADLIETSIWEYIVDTLDPVVHKYRIATDNYFYYLCLMGAYNPRNCPAYLSKRGYFNLSRRASGLDGVRLHTDSINEVVERLVPATVTAAVIMDHMDWFSPSGTEAAAEVSQLYKALAPGGRVLLRSSSTKPWYLGVFEDHGFTCSAAAVRRPGTAIDRVNMYASTWVCTKPGMQPLSI